MKIQHHILILLATVSFAVIPFGAHAGVGKVSNPSITKGEAEIEYSGVRYGDRGKAQDNKQKHSYELEYSFTDRFMFGIEAASTRETGKDHMLSAYGLEAQYQLTKQGDWLLDSAIKGE